MAGKLSGLGGAVVVDDAASVARTISNDITNWTLATPRAVQDTTGIDKSAMERLLLLADVSITLNGIVNYDDNMSHDTLSSVSSTSVPRNIKIQPTTDTLTYLSSLCLITDYQITRSNAGDLTFQAPAVLSDGTTPTWVNS